MRSKWMTLMGFAVLMLLGRHLSVVAEERPDEKGAEQAKKLPYPDNIAGFSGVVHGVVVEKKSQDVITFKVARVVRLLEGNKAQDPDALIEKTVQVAWGTIEDKMGKLCRAFIQKLKEGDKIYLGLRHFNKDQFTIPELSEIQRALALGGGPRWGEEGREGGEGGPWGHRDRRGRHGERRGEEGGEDKDRHEDEDQHKDEDRNEDDRARGEQVDRDEGNRQQEGKKDTSAVDNDYDD